MEGSLDLTRYDALVGRILVIQDITVGNPEKFVGRTVAVNNPPVNATLPIVRIKKTIFGQILVGLGLGISLMR